MAKCMVMGHGKLPSLPIDELNQLKTTVFSVFPHVWHSPELFEKIWKDCGDAIGQACKRLRMERER